jgi:hypothetical protein
VTCIEKILVFFTKKEPEQASWRFYMPDLFIEGNPEPVTIFNQSLLKMQILPKQFQQAGIKAWSALYPLYQNQGLIDPDQVFDRDHDRDENFLIKV